MPRTRKKCPLCNSATFPIYYKTTKMQPLKSKFCPTCGTIFAKPLHELVVWKGKVYVRRR